MGLRATGGGASSDLDHGASLARGDLDHGAGAQPPLLLEEAALSQMLSLSAPDTEVQCLRDCLWAPLPASASRSLLLATNFLSWSASPEQPAPRRSRCARYSAARACPHCTTCKRAPAGCSRNGRCHSSPSCRRAYALHAALHVAQRRP